MIYITMNTNKAWNWGNQIGLKQLFIFYSGYKATKQLSTACSDTVGWIPSCRACVAVPGRNQRLFHTNKAWNWGNQIGLKQLFIFYSGYKATKQLSTACSDTIGWIPSCKACVAVPGRNQRLFHTSTLEKNTFKVWWNLAFSNNIQFELKSLATLLLHSPAPLRLVNSGSKLRTKPKNPTKCHCTHGPTVVNLLDKRQRLEQFQAYRSLIVFCHCTSLKEHTNKHDIAFYEHELPFISILPTRFLANGAQEATLKWVVFSSLAVHTIHRVDALWF